MCLNVHFDIPLVFYTLLRFIMKPYFGLRGSSLNIMISIIAGLDFLYAGTLLFKKYQKLTKCYIDYLVMTSMSLPIAPLLYRSFTYTQQGRHGRSIDLELIRHSLP